MKHFKEELENYIHYYNNKRMKLKLMGLSPVQYRMKILNELNFQLLGALHNAVQGYANQAPAEQTDASFLSRIHVRITKPPLKLPKNENYSYKETV